MVETMSCATVPNLVVTLNHASGAGYYAMAGQGFDPHFTFSGPTARLGVMEGDSAGVALYAAEMEKHKGRPLSEDLREAVERTRGGYERWLDARYAAARGHCDAVIDPLDTRGVLSLALEGRTFVRLHEDGNVVHRKEYCAASRASADTLFCFLLACCSSFLRAYSAACWLRPGVRPSTNAGARRRRQEAILMERP
jgi:hypothetical protein